MLAFFNWLCVWRSGFCNWEFVYIVVWLYQQYHPTSTYWSRVSLLKSLSKGPVFEGSLLLIACSIKLPVVRGYSVVVTIMLTKCQYKYLLTTRSQETNVRLQEICESSSQWPAKHFILDSLLNQVCKPSLYLGCQSISKLITPDSIWCTLFVAVFGNL